MKDTTEQIKALGFDRHLSVMANAGSGKTRVLVKRFVNLLLYHNVFLKGTPRLKTSEIVAITFTRKAAAEMRAKVIKMFGGEIAQATDRDKLEKLYRIREELSNARISTIHSFCSALLREFPIEADVNPAFMDITAAQLNRIKKDAILSTFEDRLESKDYKIREEAEKLLLIFGRRELESLINTLLAKIELFDSLKSFYSKPPDEIIQNSLALFFDKYIPEISCAVSEIASIFQSRLNDFEVKKRETAISLLSAVSGLNTLIEKNREFNFDAAGRIYNLLSVIKDIAFTKSGTILSKIKKNTLDEATAGRIEWLWGKCTALFPFFESLKNAGAEKETIETAVGLIGITEDVISRIDEEKAELTALDFGDMILKINRLLDNPDAAAKIRKKIRFLLVDEFQDTDNLQYGIIAKLLPQLKSSGLQDSAEGQSMINLFIVGDPKQSIYGFRNADVRVFRNATRDIEKLNTSMQGNGIIPSRMSSFSAAGEQQYSIVENNYSDEEKSGRLKLTSTFRLLPVIAAFINKVCGSLMDEKISEYDVGYSEFVCGRNTGDLSLDESFNTGRLGLIIKVKERKAEIASDDEDGSDESGASEQNEAALLASHLSNMVASGILIEDDGIPREIKYRDIAVLARTRNNLQALENEFLKSGIPYILHSGRGFLKSQEVTDIIAFINFLITPSDSISLATILRSPFFHLTDTQLFTVSQQKTGKSLWEKLLSVAGENAGRTEQGKTPGSKDFGVIARTVDILNEILAEFPSMPVTQVINSILNKTARYGTISDENKRDIIEYNINQLLEMARDFDKRSFSGLFDFAEEVNFLMSYGISESETAEITDADSVNIMTIHASKGLEFPMVYLYDSNYKSGRRDDYFLSEKLGFQFKSQAVKSNAVGVKFSTTIETPSYILAKLEHGEKQAAEDKRLLYVALSRAKDYLFVSGTITMSQLENGLPDSLLGLILKSMGSLSDGIKGGAPLISQEIFMYSEGQIEKKTITYKIDIITETASQEMTLADEMPEVILPGMNLLNELELHSGGDTYSPSSITHFLSDKEDYLRKYVLKLGDEENTVIVKDDEEQDSDETDTGGAAAGTVIHGVMEKIREWCDGNGNIDENCLNRVVNEMISQIRENINKNKLKSRVITECANVMNTNLVRKHLGEMLNALKEWELNMPVGEDYLKCIIDAAPVIGGEMVIWDWKTNKAGNPGELQNLINHYELQMKTYCYLVSLLQPGQENYKARLLFTRLAKDGAEDESWTHLYSWTEPEIRNFGNEIECYIRKIKLEYYS